MAKAKVAITTASMSLYELSYLQIPTIAITVSYDQIQGISQLKQFNILTNYINIENINSNNLNKKLEELPKNINSIIQNNGLKNIENKLLQWIEQKVIIVSGGAGYIGGNVARNLLLNTKYHIVVIDNLSTGTSLNIQNLQQIRKFDFYQIDLLNKSDIESIYKIYNNIDATFHFAASTSVVESNEKPEEYYVNNVISTINLVSINQKFNIGKFIFSSTAAIYGNTNVKYIDELLKPKPINTYGKTKLICEDIIKEIIKDNKYIILRYFNVAGASIDNKIGPSKSNNSLINLLAQKVVSKDSTITVFGDQYNTKDGTAIRDYIYIEDIVQAHYDLLEYLDNGDCGVFNIGYGNGFTVKEVIETMEKVANFKFDITIDNNLLDIESSVSNGSKIRSKVNWQPKYNDLEFICKSAYEWAKKV
jgi:UDP-glucose 4-epimerase